MLSGGCKDAILELVGIATDIFRRVAVIDRRAARGSKMLEIIQRELPIAVEEDQESEGFCVYIPIAEDNGLISTVESRLLKTRDESFPNDTYEFAFGIAVWYTDDREPISWRTQDREDAKSYIPVRVRGRVMDAVVFSLRLLLMRVSPPWLYGTAKERIPPAPLGRWVKKYELLIRSVELLGYQKRKQTTDREGHVCWLMQRTAPLTAQETDITWQWTTPRRAP